MNRSWRQGEGPVIIFAIVISILAIYVVFNVTICSSSITSSSSTSSVSKESIDISQIQDVKRKDDYEVKAATLEDIKSLKEQNAKTVEEITDILNDPTLSEYEKYEILQEDYRSPEERNKDISETEQDSSVISSGN